MADSKADAAQLDISLAASNAPEAGSKVRISLTLERDHVRYLDALVACDGELNRSLVVRRIVAEHRRAFELGQRAAAVLSPGVSTSSLSP